MGDNSVKVPATMDEIESYLSNDRLTSCIQKLKAKFGESYEKLLVSDVLDAKGHQYVNLVQKGGGVLGISLVGYTYMLELVNIRFMRLAGTSAGAINTALMTVIGKKEDAKSKTVLKAIIELNFFDLVDGHPVMRRLIRTFITHTDFSIRLKRIVLGYILLLAFSIIGAFVFLGLEIKTPDLSIATRGFFVLTGLMILVLVLLFAYIDSLLKRFKDSGFGINPGNFFYDWIKKRLRENDVITVQDLIDKAGADVDGLCMRDNRTESILDLRGDVTFITSEVATENKIQFPEMCNLFSSDINKLEPAGFIRASMSIPIFFESYFIRDIQCETEEIKQAWKDRFNLSDPPTTARFVDGGILSDFPMSIFYKPNINIPRLPSLGIDLDDNKPDDKKKHPGDWSIAGYFGRIFNTTRFYYDKDFLLKNKMFGKGIGKVPLCEFNWLNFFLKPEEKIDMFLKGAEAATEFLLNFDWEEYKENRETIQKQLKNNLPATNSY